MIAGQAAPAPPAPPPACPPLPHLGRPPHALCPRCPAGPPASSGWRLSGLCSVPAGREQGKVTDGALSPMAGEANVPLWGPFLIPCLPWCPVRGADAFHISRAALELRNLWLQRSLLPSPVPHPAQLAGQGDAHVPCYNWKRAANK